MKWISVKREMPAQIHCLGVSAHKQVYAVFHVVGVGFFPYGHTVSDVEIEITHWMPLPPIK